MKLPEKTNQEQKIILLEAKSDVLYQNYYLTMVTISRAGGLVSIVREDKGKKK